MPRSDSDGRPRDKTPKQPKKEKKHKKHKKRKEADAAVDAATTAAAAAVVPPSAPVSAVGVGGEVSSPPRASTPVAATEKKRDQKSKKDKKEKKRDKKSSEEAAASPTSTPTPTPTPTPAKRRRRASGGAGAVTAPTAGAAAARGDTALAAAAKWRLDAHLQDTLQRQGVGSFFPIQQHVIPTLLRAERSHDPRMGDVCISAPTGSGKTLAYVLPIVEVLLHRVVPRLRALVLVPTRDLVVQVANVFTTYTEGTPLRVSSVTAHRSFADEQADLAHSTLDVLVCTPGRLVDHLDHTPGFTLQHLRFLVVDEADRMLSQSYHNWVNRVHESVFSVSSRAHHDSKGPGADGPCAVLPFMTARSMPSLGARVSDAYPASLLLGEPTPTTPGTFVSTIPTPFRRIICSATLTSNPQKLAMLSLSNPMHFSNASAVTKAGAQNGASTAAGAGAGAAAGAGAPPAAPPAAPAHDDGAASASEDDLDLELPAGVVLEEPHKDRARYSTPANLTESMVVCNAEDKFLVLVFLLRRFVGKSVIVFTNSVDTTHWVARMLQLFGHCTSPDGEVLEFSSRMPQHARALALTRLRDGSTPSVVVSSDAAARGLDIQGLDVVIQYDPASRVKTYIHRVGRTARAGADGISVALLKVDQVKFFKDMMRRIDNGFVKKETVGRHKVQPMLRRFSAAEQQLKKLFLKEQRGRTPVHTAVPALGDDAPTVDWSQVGVKAKRMKRKPVVPDTKPDAPESGAAAAAPPADAAPASAP